MSRRFAALVFAVVAATGLLASPAGSSEVRAATPGLTIVTDARYDVQPDAHRVRVTLDMVLRNRLSDTKTQRFYFDHAFLSVLPGASSPKLTWSGSGAPKATVSKATSAVTNLRLDLGARLYSGKSAAYRLVFDIVDAGGAANRQVRIGDSLVSFPVWAFATNSTPGSTVRVEFPAGYQVQVASGAMPAPTTSADGTVVLQTGSLKTPLTFFAHLVADRSGAMTDRDVASTVGDTPVQVTVSSWAEDKAWGTHVGDLAGRALPVLAERIGLAWPRTGGLTIRETVGRSSGGYAGLFDPATGRIDVAYDASDEVVLHEAAHSWFNGTLLADRWAAEAFASYYARDVAPDLKVAIKPGADPDTIPASLEAGRIPSTRGARWATSRARPRTTPTRLRSSSPGRSASGSATTACARSGPTRRPGPAPTSRRPRRPRRMGVRRRHPRPSTVRPTGGACSTCSTSTRRHHWTTCGGPGSRDPRTWLCSTLARRPVPGMRRWSRVPGTGSCPSPSAMRCGPGGSTTRTGC